MFYLLSFFLRYFLIKHGILFTNSPVLNLNARFHLFLCCSFLNLQYNETQQESFTTIVTVTNPAFLKMTYIYS